MMLALMLRDLRRGFGGPAWIPAVFFLLVVSVVPFAIGADSALLARIGPGAMWIAALTAALMPIERLIEPDRAEGVLDQLTLHGMSDELVALVKILAHWLSFTVPIMLAALIGSALLGLDRDQVGRLAAALAIGTPGLAALAVMVAALTAGVPRASSLAGLLLFPLAVPLLIFASAYTSGGGAGPLLVEGAIALALLAMAPLAAGAAIRAART